MRRLRHRVSRPRSLGHRAQDPTAIVALITALSLTIGQNILLSVLLPRLMLEYGPFVMTGLVLWNVALARLVYLGLRRLG